MKCNFTVCDLMQLGLKLDIRMKQDYYWVLLRFDHVLMLVSTPITIGILVPTYPSYISVILFKPYRKSKCAENKIFNTLSTNLGSYKEIFCDFSTSH